MTFEYLKYFISAYKFGSLYKAAKHLYITPQGVGRGIKKLEDELGEDLFLRTQAGLQPTEFSKRIYPRVKKLVEDIEELYDIADCYKKSASNVINLGLLGHNAISDAIRIAAEEFYENNLDYKIVMTVFPASEYENLYKKLETGEIDLAWTFHTDMNSKYKYYPFRRNSIKCAMSGKNPLAAKETLQWPDLNGQSFVMAGKNELFPKLISEQCAKYDFVPYEAYYSLDSAHMAKLICNDKAMGLLFFEYIDTIGTICPDIVFKNVEPPLYMTASLITMAENSSAAVKKAASFIRSKLIYSST